jgi:hypothetical protein
VASGVEFRMNREGSSALLPADCSAGATGTRQELVRRVVSSSTFEKSPKLRAFLIYVCRCAFDNEPAAATEQQIGIHVFGRSPGYNPNEDNIVRSQARLLRLKLEHHFSNEGSHEAVLITIPKGRYLPSFEERDHGTLTTHPPVPGVDRPKQSRRSYLKALLVMVSVVFGVGIVWLAGTALRSKESSSIQPAIAAVHRHQPEVARGAAVPVDGEVRIAAGNTGAPYIDIRGRRWDSDQFYNGGVSGPGPQELFPPVSDPSLFGNLRQGAATETSAPQAQNEFRYDIPVKSGVYELRLFFADPARQTVPESGEDAQNLRHFQVNLNGRPILMGFDPIADAGQASVDIRAFKDVSPAADGRVHLQFVPAGERPFVSAIELTPGTRGKLKPIRFSARKSDFVDGDGIEWDADNYFIGGRTTSYSNSEPDTKIPELYSVERYGNFGYAIPVSQGSYTVKLHFMESFFGPSVPTGLCRGAGCRVFDVTCNGEMLLKDFDIFQAAGGAFRPLVRTFHNLHPNGQGKLLLSFLPKVNYAEVRAIEVIDEAR